jgi:hypothetical protein
MNFIVNGLLSNSYSISFFFFLHANALMGLCMYSMYSNSVVVCVVGGVVSSQAWENVWYQKEKKISETHSHEKTPNATALPFFLSYLDLAPIRTAKPSSTSHHLFRTSPLSKSAILQPLTTPNSPTTYSYPPP